MSSIVRLTRPSIGGIMPRMPASIGLRALLRRLDATGDAGRAGRGSPRPGHANRDRGAPPRRRRRRGRRLVRPRLRHAGPRFQLELLAVGRGPSEFVGGRGCRSTDARPSGSDALQQPAAAPAAESRRPWPRRCRRINGRHRTPRPHDLALQAHGRPGGRGRPRLPRLQSLALGGNWDTEPARLRSSWRTVPMPWARSCRLRRVAAWAPRLG